MEKEKHIAVTYLDGKGDFVYVKKQRMSSFYFIVEVMF